MRPPASRNQSRQVSSWCISPADRNISATRGKSSTALQRVGSRGPVFRYDLQQEGHQFSNHGSRRLAHACSDAPGVMMRRLIDTKAEAAARDSFRIIVP